VTTDSEAARSPDAHIPGCDVHANDHASTVKTGRTHLMDAMPLTLGQELSAWAA